MSAALRIAFLKPEHGVAGGLESVVIELEAIARADGHRVERLTIDMRPPRAAVAGLDIPRAVWDAAPEYFPYLAGLDGFERIDTRRYDVVISTQPPSFATRHPRHLALFYHHHRVYYDLEEAYVRAGFAPDPEVHREAGRIIRELDQRSLDDVGWFLAGSDTVAERLRRFNGLTNASTFHAGLVVGHHADDDPAQPAATGTGAVLSVGRHEFPKRTELVVAAAHLLPHLDVALVGTGGRVAWARALDHRLSTTDADPAALTDLETWCNTGQGAPDVPADHRSNVEFAGRVTDDDLVRRFAEAPCVVAPAYQEDYGLTAIEAMAVGKPVIVCTDGGGLTELVDHERTGLIVEPTPAAIAAAIERLTTDRDLAAELGANGRRRAAELSWDAAADELRAGIERVLA
ncbi:glycosyltransferase family 4 protein [Aquihabitans sp. McL0605]|uniref:glycosyltransferase family 4 protein n=1 Tax=Aquihabitans sp. McL0605 TaxID=3415671 RepID=UPI003CE7E446